MKKFKFIDTWSSWEGNHERIIGTFEAETIEEAIILAEKQDCEIDRINKYMKIKESQWSMLGVGCPHWIDIYEV